MRAVAYNKETHVTVDITDIVEDTLGACITADNSAEAEQIAYEWAIEAFGYDNCDAGLTE